MTVCKYFLFLLKFKVSKDRIHSCLQIEYMNDVKTVKLYFHIVDHISGQNGSQPLKYGTLCSL